MMTTDWQSVADPCFSGVKRGLVTGMVTLSVQKCTSSLFSRVVSAWTSSPDRRIALIRDWGRLGVSRQAADPCLEQPGLALEASDGADDFPGERGTAGERNE